MAESFCTYKGYPLVRKGKELYYGNMSDEYVCMISILSTHKVKDTEVADKVKIFLSLTDAGDDANQMIARSSDRQNMYEALDIAYTWLSKTK